MAHVACTTGTVALYLGDDGETVTAIPVEAWDDKGDAYVAGVKGLVAADSRPGFLRLEQASVKLPHPDSKPREPVKVGPTPRPQGPRDPTDPRGPRRESPRGRQP